MKLAIECETERVKIARICNGCRGLHWVARGGCTPCGRSSSDGLFPKCARANSYAGCPRSRTEKDVRRMVGKSFRKYFPSFARRASVERPSKRTTVCRPSSVPFLSGDTLRAAAGWALEDGQILINPGGDEKVLFAPTDETARKDFLRNVERWSKLASHRSPLALVLHNGDYSPLPRILRRASSVVDSIYSVNLAEEFGSVFALPIGLENAHHEVNGVIENFHTLRSRKQDGALPEGQRVLASFRVRTNEKVRGPIAELFRHSPHGFRPDVGSAADYHLLVATSRFVISPPGNGRDCHRTWESIYLGSVPVVLEGSLPQSLVSCQAILEVKDYEEFLGLSSEQLDVIYRDSMARGDANAMAQPWLDRISGVATAPLV